MNQRGMSTRSGPDVTSVKKGDPVIVTLLASCGHCYYLSDRNASICARICLTVNRRSARDQKGQPVIQKAGVAGFAEYVLVNESQIVKIPADMPMDRAALLACGVMTGFGAVVNRAKVKPMSSVVVRGDGRGRVKRDSGGGFLRGLSGDCSGCH